jgi:1-deoxy-D-xylulose-5-phosphate reductoisomerase
MIPRKITVLGATGSVGLSTLDLIGRSPERFEVVALTAGSNAAALAELAIRHRAKHAAIADPEQFSQLKERLTGTGISAAAGEQAVIDAARMPADWIMAAIVGAAGLKPTFAAAEQGTCVALANKECLVSAGDVFLTAIKASGATLLPVDSEHSAAFQAVDTSPSHCIEAITLTASGGPFRSWDAERLKTVRVEDALKHPNWSMGRKITIDSATLMNKGLELIEAFHLFPVEAHQLGAGTERSDRRSPCRATLWRRRASPRPRAESGRATDRSRLAERRRRTRRSRGRSPSPSGARRPTRIHPSGIRRRAGARQGASLHRPP